MQNSAQGTQMGRDSVRGRCAACLPFPGTAPCSWHAPALLCTEPPIHYLPVPGFHGPCHCHTVTNPAALQGTHADSLNLTGGTFTDPRHDPTLRKRHKTPTPAHRRGPKLPGICCVPGGMPSSRETLVFGVGASPRLRTPHTTTCSIGAKCHQRPPRGSGYPGAEPHPVLQHCSGRAGNCFLQFNQGN